MPAPDVTVRGALDQSDGEAVWAAVATVYAGFLGGDAGAVDDVLAADVTIWNHDHVPLMRGTADLDAVREARRTDPSPGPAVTALAPHTVLVDAHGDVAWCRHLLDVTTADGATSTARVTDVLRRDGGRWVVVHHHEQEVPAHGLP
ncbi:nuclear transport factor 2 family protein [Klenkia sp. PcliD-1-E]|uniref:nuclear transport factor 2 family protein n=1 Tax=Klenkia sp. PcliD-1-E TaxID=2954492 RepID=UPI002098215D|nr:nuclear transport factor 2 family protein [Klenkia sp. PcliD-1-E]MCO7220598.1 nuclear transport factor 2 family protein [Klenkia sp. PcliD-1-E]